MHLFIPPPPDQIERRTIKLVREQTRIGGLVRNSIKANENIFANQVPYVIEPHVTNRLLQK